MKKKQRQPEVTLCHCGDHAFAPLTRGFITLVDPEDSDLLATHCWEARVEPNGMVYAVRAVSGGLMNTVVYLHRVIAARMRLKPSQQAPERRH
jgi:hypothetical protein